MPFFFLALILAVALDRGTKAFVLSGAFPAFPGFSVRHHSWQINPMTLTALLFLELGSAAMAAGFSAPAMQVALGLAAGGAAGNSIDQIRYGGVVDFIDLKVWPAFNLADAAIVLGAALAFIALI